MIKKMLLLFCCLNVFATAPVFADTEPATFTEEEAKALSQFIGQEVDKAKAVAEAFGYIPREKRIYIYPAVAENIIDQIWGHINSDRIFTMTGRFTDDSFIKHQVLSKFNKCIKLNAYMSVDCIYDICNSVFSHIDYSAIESIVDPNETDEEKLKEMKKLQKTKMAEMGNTLGVYCRRFAEALTSSPLDLKKPHCLYDISKVGDNQMRIKYTRKDGTGYYIKRGKVLDNGYLKGPPAWRLNNPGNISYTTERLACQYIDLVTGGVPRVWPAFDDMAIGRLGVKNLFMKDRNYKNEDIAGGIKKYAPPSDSNNTEAYIRHVTDALKARGGRGNSEDYETLCLRCDDDCVKKFEKEGKYEWCLSEKELDIMIDAIQDHEDSNAGWIDCYDGSGSPVECPSNIK